MIIEGKIVRLRDFCEADIPARILWETEQTEWQQWDAPWEYYGLSEAEREAELEKYQNAMCAWAEKYKSMPDSTPRTGFQIDYKRTGLYIGWCNCYSINEDYTYIDGEGLCAVGIDIPDMSARGKGCAFEALVLFIDYLVENGEKEIYTQTWSGNVRMIALAEKLGFVECCRKAQLRIVRGEKYDGLTFKLDFDRFNSVREIIYA